MTEQMAYVMFCFLTLKYGNILVYLVFLHNMQVLLEVGKRTGAPVTFFPPTSNATHSH